MSPNTTPGFKLASIAFLAFLALVSSPGRAQVSRTFVSTSGSDANTATNCGPTTPCRSFAAALTATAAGGEIIVQSSGGYGPAPITITQSVTITAPDGVYAGITVAATSQYGVVVNGSGIEVALRGLTFEGQGAADAIRVNDGVGLTVERCTIHAFSEAGIYINAPQVHVTVADSTLDMAEGTNGIANGTYVTVHNSVISATLGAAVHSNQTGAFIRVSDSLIVGNLTNGIEILSDANVIVSGTRIDGTNTGKGSGMYLSSLASTSAAVTGSVITGWSNGITLAPNLLSTVDLSVKGTTISDNTTGINGQATGITNGPGEQILLDVSDSVLSESGTAASLSTVSNVAVMHAVFARSSLSNNAIGVSLWGGGGTADVTLSGCVFANNGVGLETVPTSGNFKGFFSLGNNTFVGGGVSGTYTVVPLR